MSKPPLWSLTATTQPEAEEAVTELMQHLFATSASVFQDAASGKTRITVFLVQPPAPSSPGMKALRLGLRRVRLCGLVKITPRIRIQKMRAEDWAESWKRHFKPMEIAGTLLLRPSWSHSKTRRGLVEITLDPGLSFGTGHHPTTQFCLEELVRLRPSRDSATAMLDVGTGSGILAIAAARLGYAPVEAFDADPDSIRVARENATRNRTAHHIRFVQRNLEPRAQRVGPRRYPVMCANLTHDLLLTCQSTLLDWLRPGGTLILAGILTRQFANVAEAYQMAGGTLIRSRRQKEWRSGSFYFKATNVPG